MKNKVFELDLCSLGNRCSLPYKTRGEFFNLKSFRPNINSMKFVTAHTKVRKKFVRTYACGVSIQRSWTGKLAL